jgi:predicted dithiol-disulfide oxidoreductase (DUF899 family)
VASPARTQVARGFRRPTAAEPGLPVLDATEPYVLHVVHDRLSLIDLFEARRQPMVQHFMWLWAQPCAQLSA